MNALVYDPDLPDRFAISINSEGVFAKEPNTGLLDLVLRILITQHTHTEVKCTGPITVASRLIGP
jgi:hypothetical protein